MSNRRHRVFLFALVFLATLVVGGAARAAEENTVASAETAWKNFLAKNFSVGQTEKQVRQAMNAKYRDTLNEHLGGSGRYQLFFLVDDFHFVEFDFDRESKLSTLPIVKPKHRWLRFPDGKVVFEQGSEDKLSSEDKEAADKLEKAIAARQEIKDQAIAKVLEQWKFKTDEVAMRAQRSRDDKYCFVTAVFLDRAKHVWVPEMNFEVTDDGRIEVLLSE